MARRSNRTGAALRSVADELFSAHGRGIAAYEYFARVVGLLLSLAVSVIILVALFYLFRALVTESLSLRPQFEYALFQHLFEMILTVLIALEFNHTLAEIVAGRGGLIQVRAVILIGILVIVRKFILIEIESTPALFLMGLALSIFALGIVYWLVVDVERRHPPDTGEAEDDAQADGGRTTLP